jgi:hypothetical protein
VKTTLVRLSLLAALTAVASASQAAPSFVNGLALPGNLHDMKEQGKPTDSKLRVGYFSDIYCDPARNEWWGLSDRGPGGGVLSYGTRAQRFTLDINPETGAISNFKIVESVHFRNKVGESLDGIAPGAALDASNLGNSFDPEGIVVNPATGTFLVSDEYGPSLYEFDRDGTLLRAFKTPESLKPTSSDGSYNFDNDDSALAADKVATGRRTNRGFEGLAISPDGFHAYAMLQSAMVNEGAGDGVCNRIVKFDTVTGIAVAQYAYKMEGSSQGRGISALVALNQDEFFVLERNNRGIGVGATLASPNKKVFRINLAGAADVSATPLSNTTCAALSVTKNTTPFLDLAANTLTALGNNVPEKWEGLAIGPQLNDGSYLLLAGTDNDYSVTQNASGTQFDVYFDFSDPDPYADSIQCPMAQVKGCFHTTGGAPATLTAEHQLLPGVLHAYKVPAADLGAYVPPDAQP